MTAHTTDVRMLIVEDNPEMALGLEEFFELQGYQVDRAVDGEEGLQRITSLPPYDVVLLDVRMPKMNGFDVLREARRAGVRTPIIVVTVNDSRDDRLQGFELGADDYVGKPFNVEELAARVKAVLRRSNSPAHAPMELFEIGPVTINFSTHSAQRNGKPVEFTALEFDILRYFIQHRGRTVSRKQLLRDVWGISGEVTTRTIDRHVASIRKKIDDDPTAPDYIETVYGIGYKFSG